MKKLIAIIISLACIAVVNNCKGQYAPHRRIQIDSSCHFTFHTDTMSYCYTYDTVPAVLLVCDTLTKRMSINEYWTFDNLVNENTDSSHFIGHIAYDTTYYTYVFSKAFWTYGYVVFISINKYSYDYSFGYLSESKKPYPNNIIVWDYKLINQ